jgi:hypothetical protein
VAVVFVVLSTAVIFVESVQVILLTLTPEPDTVTNALFCRPEPRIVTVVETPRLIDDGVTELTCGPAATVKQFVQVARWPSGFTTVTSREPVRASDATLTARVSWVEVVAVTLPETAEPENVTVAFGTKPVPFTLTVSWLAPCPTVLGVTPVTVGAVSTVKVTGADVPVLPDASVWEAVTV